MRFHNTKNDILRRQNYMGNLIGVQSEVEDLMDSRKKILNNIGIKVGEAVTSRARDGKISDHLMNR